MTWTLGLAGVAGLAVAWLIYRLRAAERSRREAAGLASNRAERLDAILNTTLDGIIVIDTRGTIEAFNSAAERLFGYPASEVIGRNVSLLMPSPDQEQHDRYLERYATTGVASIIGAGREVTGRRRDGSPVPIHLSVGEMRIGGERKFTGLLHDLSKRTHLDTQLQASEARWRAIIDSAVDGIVVIDAYGRIEAFNPAAERLFGHLEGEVLGRNVNMLMPSPYREEHDRYLYRYLATGTANIIGSGRDVQGLRKDGTAFPLHLSVGQMTIAGEKKFSGILHDLSDRVRMETELRDSVALARLGEMAAVVAHEVKNPLAGIRAAVEILGTHVPPDDQDASMARDILARIDALDGLMKDLLLFARPPKPRHASTEIGSLVERTAELLQRDRSLRDVRVEVRGTAPPILADADMLQIVFHNLLINGAHAMKGRGRISVAIDSTDALCDIAFSDEGPGIPSDVRDHVFMPFFTTKSGGSGLGLPTAKRLVEAHHGKISIDCPAGGGTTVAIRLPREAAQSADIPS